MRLRLIGAQIATAMFAFSLDRLTKAWVLENLRDVVVKPLIPGFMQLHLTANTGMAWSVGQNNAPLMTVIASLVTLTLVVWAARRHRVHPRDYILEKCGAGLMMGGAIGNLFDRFTRGRVTDFLEFTFFDFPIFNVADALIDVGLGLIFIDHFKNGKTIRISDDAHE
ncbi:MAG: signal peptidase II [Cyanobacteria bacterium SZAS TMP-1]|nr:signal peptidase II [Cyanobacteria bacterium SZAS TMP-1]